MAVGALVFGLSGACTLTFLSVSLSSVVRNPDTALTGLATSIPMVAIIGGLPTIIGFFVMRGGYRWYRGEKPKPPPG